MTDAPDYGELQEFAGWLDAAHAEMITSDLRDLQIPAVMCNQPVEPPEAGVETARLPDKFQILVPEAFLQIAHEVLEVTHARPEGETSTEEILRDLEDPTVQASVVPPTRTELRGRRRAGMARLLFGFVLAVAVVGAVLSLL